MITFICRALVKTKYEVLHTLNSKKMTRNNDVKKHKGWTHWNVKVKINYTYIYMCAYIVYYDLINYQPGLLSDLIFDIFLIIRIFFYIWLLI